MQVKYHKGMKYSFRLRLYRLTRGLSQRDVANLMGHKDTSLISRWENGFSLPDLENAFKLAGVYCLTVDELFRDIKKEINSSFIYAR